VYAGAWRLPELLDEFDEFDEFEEFEEAEPDPDEPEEAAPVEPELVEPEPVLAVPLPDELREEVTVLCVEPGSATASAPAATTLAKPTVAVAAFSLRRPRSRSATARERLRVLCRDPGRPRDDPLPNSGLLIPSVWHAQL
jgi:hypothetical protein